MNKLETIIDCVKKNNHAIMVPYLIEKMKLRGYNVNKDNLLIHIRKTYHLKKGKFSNLIEYVKNPKLPEIIQEKIDGYSEPENIEELFIIFIVKSQYIPDRYEFRRFCKPYNFLFNWDNLNNYQSLKKKWLKRLIEVKLWKK